MNDKINKNTNFALLSNGYFCTTLQVINNCSGFGSSYFCVSSSHERKFERMERKFRTQNPSHRGLRVLDETTAKPFSMPDASMYDDLIGDDETLQENWDRICEIYEEMQSQGLCVCGNPSLGEVRTLLSIDIKNEQEIEYVLKHMYVKRIDVLRTWTKEKLSYIQSTEENEDSFILIGNRVTDYRIKKTNNSKVISECSFEDSKQSLVIDLDFVKHLPTGTRYLISNKLFPELININKAGVLPFDLVMTNLGDLENYYSIRKQLPKGETVEQETLCEKWTDKCHTELFPKENLVLVSPFSENELVYDPNDTYVITALAGYDIQDHIHYKALEKAENDGIRHSIYIRTVSSKRLLSAWHNCFKLCSLWAVWAEQHHLYISAPDQPGRIRKYH